MSQPTLSTSVIIGIAIIATAALALGITLLVVYLRRSHRTVNSVDRKIIMEKGFLSSSVTLNTRSPICINLPISKPMPLVHAAGRHNPKLTIPDIPQSFRPQLSARACMPIPASLISTSSPDVQSIISLSRRDSISSTTSGTTIACPDQLKVHHDFTPRLPDELSVSHGEYVKLVQAFDDGWYVIGRHPHGTYKSKLERPGIQDPFEQPKKHTAPDNVEVGVVPAWVFKANHPQNQLPKRMASLGATLILNYPESDHVISWSHFW